MSRAAHLALGLAFSIVMLPLASLGQDLPMDPAWVRGELDNGLRYYVRQHANPPGRAALWVHIHSGSLNETDPQRGLAHYLEHLAFNGSANFPPGSVVPFFQGLGMTFGRDQNAFTNFEQTTYQLSLPDAQPGTLGQGMTFFADVLSRLLLLPAEIDAERQIILEERRRGLSGRQRVGDYVLEHLAPGSLYSQRDTIGLEETILAVKQPDFLDYYNKWYVASNATVIVVADMDPAVVVKLIGEKFGDAPKRPRPTPQDPRVTPYQHSIAIVASDAEVRTEDVRITRIEPARPPTLTVEQYREDLVDRLGQSAMNRRLDAKTAQGGTSYLSARVSTGNDSNALYSAEISARAMPGQWRESLEETALELQRARAFGFTSRELDDVRKQTLSGAERAVETEATQQASALLSRANRDVASGEPTMSAQQRLDLLHKVLPTIGDEEINQRFAREFDMKTAAFVATLPTGDGVPSEAELLEIGTRALAVKPTPEAEVAHATQLMAELPKPGVVKDSGEHAATHVWSAWLGNNVRVHHRFMDERKNEVSISIALIGGELLETADNRGITSAAQLAWSRPATKQLSSTDVRDLMTGKKVNVGGRGGFGGRGGGGRRGGGGTGGAGDAITLSISGSPEDLETGFQLAYLLLTEPLIEPAAFTQFQTSTRESIQESLNNPMRLGMRMASAAPYPDNEPRTKPLTIGQLDRLTLDAAQAWLEKLIANSPIEVTIVGDLPRERAEELLVRYLGSLPTRERVSTETYASLRHLERPAGPRISDATLDTPTEQAFVLNGFYGTDDSNVADVRLLTMASRILSTRMIKEVREDAQLVYSIGAGSRPAGTYPGFGVFSASAPTEPAKVDALVEKLTSMYEAFAAGGPTADELDVAKKQMANTLEESVREPGYWSGRIDRMTYRGVNLDDVVAEPDAYQKMTADEIRAAFAKYFSKKYQIIVVVRPATGGSGETETE